MKRSELIQKLNEIPGEDPEVCIFNYKKNADKSAIEQAIKKLQELL
jgi:hypothetical protein